MEHSHSQSHKNYHGAALRLKPHTESLESWLITVFSGVPHVPPNVRKIITDIAPWLALVAAVLGFVGLIFSGILGIVLSPLVFLGLGITSIVILITMVLGLISTALLLLAFKPLQKLHKAGWNYVFYSLIVTAISSIIAIGFTFSGWSNIVGTLVGMYLLFEVREKYN